MIGNDAIEFGRVGCRSEKSICFAECNDSLRDPSLTGTVVEILESFFFGLKCVLMSNKSLVASKQALS